MAKYGGTNQKIQETLGNGCRGTPRVVTRRPPSPQKALAHARKMIMTIRRAHDRGAHRKADALARIYLDSIDARYFAVLAAYRRLKPHQRPKASKLFDIAKSLNPWAGTQEPVHLWFKQKAGNPHKFRPIMNFGIENRALQYLVLAVLWARSDTHPHQYDRRGHHEAVAEAAKLLEQGHEWAVEIDIANCFPSFDGEKVIDHLPIPKEVTRSVILSGTLNLDYDHDHDYDHDYDYDNQVGPADPDEDSGATFTQLSADARRGFPQGSATSALAVEMLLAPLFEKPPPGGASIGYVDNYLAMAKDQSGAQSMATAFWSALKAHPVGQLRPSRVRYFRPGGSIEFLGHRLQLCDGVVRIEPTKKNKEEFENILRNGLDKIGNFRSNTDRVQRHIKELRRDVYSWTASFKLCDGMDDYRDKALKRIDEAVPVAWKCN
jgi:hypothetical protein